MTAVLPPTHYDVDEIACISDDESSFSDYSSSAVEQLSASVTSMSSLEAENVLVDDVRPSRVPPLPTSVKINVEGAFIVDDESESHSPGASTHTSNDHVHWENKDIRLPHHTDVVSHVAVDVRVPYVHRGPYTDRATRSVAP
jgi:hypothetical protein